jgi:hypothetical protein
MVLNDILAALGLYEKYSKYKKIAHQQQMLEMTLIKMFYFGQRPGPKACTTYGINATTEFELNSVRELSKMDRFNAIDEGISRDLIIECHSHDQNEWCLTRRGIMYVEALLDEFNKK